MEPKQNLTPNRKRLLSYHWDLNASDYKNNLSFTWRENSIKVDIHSICLPPGKHRRVYFDFCINGKHTLYEYGYSYAGGGHHGEIPKFHTKDYKLDIFVSPFMMEIHEEKIDLVQFPITKPAHPISLEEYEKGGFEKEMNRWSLEEKIKEQWFSVSKDSGFKVYSTPFEDDGLWFWIRRTFYKLYSSDLILYEYKLYNPTLKPFDMTAEGFICQKIYDKCESKGDGVYSFISFEIVDPTGWRRHLNWGTWAIEDIARTFKFVESLRGYKDWKHYDSVRTLYRVSGVSEEQEEKP